MTMLIQLGTYALVVAASVAVAVAGLRLVRRCFAVASLQANHELGGIFFAVLGTAYGVLLSFFVVAAWNRYQAAGATGVQESAALGSMFWLAQALPPADRQPVQAGIAAYARVVIDVEWKNMANGQDSGAAWALSDKLWQAVLAIQPATENERAVYSALLEQRQTLDHDRRLRLLSARDQIPDFLWAVLDIGAFMTIFFTYFFGMRRFAPQALMTATLTGLIVLVLLLVYQLDNPYQGFARVQPDGFQSIVSLTSNPPPP